MKKIIFILLMANFLFSADIIGKKAPSFGVDNWVQTNKENLYIEDYKNKVLFILTFQDSCPYCHKKALPQLEDLQRMYADDKNIEFLVIETAFEDDAEYDVASAQSIIKDYHLKMPVGISKRDKYGRPIFMDTYKTGGTPWVTIVDKKGIIRYSNFQITLMNVVNMLETLANQ